MKRFLLFFFLINFILYPIGANERAPLPSILPILEGYVREAMVSEGVPGAVVVIVKDGKILYSKGFGVKVLEQNEPVDEHTPFALASVTKNITNTLIARLVDQGKLDWKDKVLKYLPNFQLSDSRISQELSIEDLLSHRCGLPGFTADSLIELGWSASEIIDKMALFPFEGEFRKSYGYQNALVGIVGNIIEKVTGKPLSQVYQEELFQPAGLTETHIGNNQPSSLWQKLVGLFGKKRPQPTFHDTFDGKTRFLPKGNPGLYTFPASSGITSTGHDLGKWLIFQLNKTQANSKRLISEPRVDEMRIPRIDVTIQGGRQFPKNRITKVHYGMGWFIHDYAGVPVLGHMGGMAGTRSIILIIPQDNVGIVVLANLGGMRVSLFPEAIRNKFLDLYFNVKDNQDWAKELRDGIRHYRKKYDEQRRTYMLQHLAAAGNLDNYTGTYENALYGRVEISREGNALTLIYRDRPPVKLTHWNGNTFQFAGSDLSCGFSGTDLGEIAFSDERGKSDRMMISLFHEGADPVFQRVG
jgi:CubicO group peptidase (beta-lactamase class C family)